MSDATQEQMAAKTNEKDKKSVRKKNDIKVETVVKGESPANTPVEKQKKTDDLVVKLREYKELLDEGILTQDEFNQLKKDLISNCMKQ